jgi:hypothetical protein
MQPFVHPFHCICDDCGGHAEEKNLAIYRELALADVSAE